MMHSSRAVTSGSNGFILGLASSDRAWRSSAMDDSNPAPNAPLVRQFEWKLTQSAINMISVPNLYRRLSIVRFLYTSRTRQWRNNTASSKNITFYIMRYIALSKERIKKIVEKRNEQTVPSLSTSSSVAPSEARPISCENWAKQGLASNGICPNSSWQQSLFMNSIKSLSYRNSEWICDGAYGSGV